MSRLTEAASGGINFDAAGGGSEDIRARELCAEAMRNAAAIARGVAEPPAPASLDADAVAGPRAISADDAIAELARCATELGETLRTHRSATLGAVANGTLAAEAALVRVETVRNLEAMSRHAWRSAAHLVGRG